MNIVNSKKNFYFTSFLYIIGALFQFSWIFILYKNKEQVSDWMELPLTGWVMGILFLLMTVAIPILLFIGIKLYLVIRKADEIAFTQKQEKARKTANFFLILGISVDLIFAPFLIYGEVADKSAIPIFVAFIAVRILQCNITTIDFYFDVKKENKSKMLVRL